MKIYLFFISDNALYCNMTHQTTSLVNAMRQSQLLGSNQIAGKFYFGKTSTENDFSDFIAKNDLKMRKTIFQGKLLINIKSN